MDCMAGVRAEDLEERRGRLGCWSPLFPFRPEEDRLGADSAYQMGRWESTIVEYTNSHLSPNSCLLGNWKNF